MTPYEQGYHSTLEKLAVSPEMARRALVNAVKRMPAKAKEIGGIAPIDLIHARLTSSPRTMARGARAIKVPGDTYARQGLLEEQLRSVLKGTSTQSGMDVFRATPLV